MERVGNIERIQQEPIDRQDTVNIYNKSEGVRDERNVSDVRRGGMDVRSAAFSIRICVSRAR
jgi:hypothetical protein